MRRLKPLLYAELKSLQELELRAKLNQRCCISRKSWGEAADQIGAGLYLRNVLRANGTRVPLYLGSETWRLLGAPTISKAVLHPIQQAAFTSAVEKSHCISRRNWDKYTDNP